MTEIPAPPQDWDIRAACRDTDRDSFFPEGTTASMESKYAKRLCASCPVASVIGCARTALDVNRNYSVSGVWAGQYLGFATRTREQALRALHGIAGVPYVPKGEIPVPSWPRPCSDCGRAMRPRNAVVDELPETVKYGSAGLCDTCAAAKRNGTGVGTFMKVAS